MTTEKPDSNKRNDKAEGLAPQIAAFASHPVASAQSEYESKVEATSNTRRRLIRGALGAAPVVLTLRGQSALAATGCASPSRIFSGNLSPGHIQVACGSGYSPGYWKVCQHLGQWSAGGLTAPTFKQGTTCGNGVPNPANMSDEGTLFKNIAPFVNSGALGDFSAWRILAYPALVDKNLTAFNINQIQLARHLIATYLNSNVIANFPVTLATMKDMWEKGSLDKYCPSSSCTASQLWTAQQVVCYLRNYTMDSTVSTDPITWVCP